MVFWSPDSRSIFYSVKRTLKQANLETGSTRSVANLPFLASFGAWRSKRDLLLYLGPQTVYELLVENGALWKVPGVDLRHPQFLPHSDRVLHVAVDPSSGGWRAQVTDYVSRKVTPLMETDSRVQYAPSLRRGELGTLLYLRRGGVLFWFNPLTRTGCKLRASRFRSCRTSSMSAQVPKRASQFPTTASWSIKRVGLFRS